MSAKDVIAEALRGCGIDESEKVEVPAVVEALTDAGYLSRVPDLHTCISCGVELSRVFGDSSPLQYENALDIKLTGGYSMFFDNIDGDHHVFLCHDCAHITCEVIPWLGELINPEHSHAHTAEYWQAHPEHEGWDWSHAQDALQAALDAQTAPGVVGSAGSGGEA